MNDFRSLREDEINDRADARDEEQAHQAKYKKKWQYEKAAIAFPVARWEMRVIVLRHGFNVQTII